MATVLIFTGCRERLTITPTPQMDIADRFKIRVLLFDDVTQCSVGAPGSFVVAVGRTNFNKVYFNKTAEHLKVRALDNKILVDSQPFDNKRITILPDEPFVFTVNQRDYRGNLTFVLNDDGRSFDVINVVPLEAYLAGVVGAEMPNYWETEALKAQAIAARTYCLYIKKRFGVRRRWDVRATQANQVYLGTRAESPQVWAAVNKTTGQVLLCRNDEGTDELFPAYYSSICGGHTENSKNVFGDSFAPLAGVECPYCRDVAKMSFFYWPMAQFDKDVVGAALLKRYPALKNLKRVVDIVPAKKSDYSGFSRLTSIKLLGSSGKTGYLRAEDLRLVIDPTGTKLKSTICRVASLADKWAFVSGRGYGHGVGMCQCGAQGMARIAGKTAKEILYYYYPNSKIENLY